jgi:hypothetical protein
MFFRGGFDLSAFGESTRLPDNPDSDQEDDDVTGDKMGVARL